METASSQCIGDQVETRIATGYGDWKNKCIAVPEKAEAYYSRLYEEEFESSLQRLAKAARMVPRDDGTTGFEFG
ncbi:hypothetical protein [Acidovorax sp. NB1]|uniref:hypothetical protein n=1 Tax=Acidovorax sp. NB1 TaxID=1943571 RepID=UPI0010E6E9A5|nr:hypothetical protein [Acidovorax sp. NB1]GDY37706.1 hypothetical protein ACINB_35980 [Acidovorax sp. NB1]